MTQKYNVETTAVIDRNPVGSEIVLPAKAAKYYESVGYVRILSEVKPKAKPKSALAKKASAPKKPAAKTTASKPKEK